MSQKTKLPLKTFYLSSRFQKQARLANNYKAERYNETIDNSRISEKRKKQKQKTQTRLNKRDEKGKRLGKNNLQIFSGEIILRKKVKKDKSKKKSRQYQVRIKKNTRLLEGIIKQKLSKIDKNGNNYLLLKLTNWEVIFVFASKIKAERWDLLEKDKLYKFTVEEGNKNNNNILGGFELKEQLAQIEISPK